MKISFETITERDMDLLLMRKISYDPSFLKDVFLKAINYQDRDLAVTEIKHSVSTEDGESDIEVILTDENGRKIALLIEDKINAPAMENQEKRYHVRGDKAQERSDYDEYHVFIVAPEKYIKNNSEAGKYKNKICYETINGLLTDPFEKAVLDRALDVSKHGYVTIYNEHVTDFWDKLYDFVDEEYPGEFKLPGKKGLARSGDPGQWISITCNNQYGIQIKCDRGYVDLEIRGYANKIEQFCKNNQSLIDEKKLYLRPAGKSLAIRKYIDRIDFSKDFETQKDALHLAFEAAKELQDLIKSLNIK